jgi:hypothetical protein
MIVPFCICVSFVTRRGCWWNVAWAYVQPNWVRSKQLELQSPARLFAIRCCGELHIPQHTSCMQLLDSHSIVLGTVVDTPVPLCDVVCSTLTPLPRTHHSIPHHCIVCARVGTRMRTITRARNEHVLSHTHSPTHHHTHTHSLVRAFQGSR